MANVTWRILFRWAFLNKTGAAKAATFHDLLEWFSIAADTGGLFHFIDDQGMPNGIILANVNHNVKSVEVLFALLTSKGLLKQAFRHFHTEFPGYSLTAFRYGKPITYFQ